MENVVIREARRKDCRELRRLMQELAEFEKMANDSKLTVEALEHDGFDATPPLFYGYVAEIATNQQYKSTMTKSEKEQSSGMWKTTEKYMQIIGYVLYFFGYSSQKGRTIYLEDIYVTPQYRGIKLGSALFDEVAKKGLHSGCIRMDLVVLDWNPAMDFYKQKGAIDITAENKFNYFSINREAMEQLQQRRMRK